ncbi:unnamed protein product [Tenebrio molitor]|nr:unnamed protein product [Tenebrio molitor]
METTRRFTALNKHLTIVLKRSWDDFSTTYTDLVQISEIHCNLCEAAILINRYFEVQMLTAFSVSFYYFISIFFYFFTGFNIVSQYRTFFYVVNALIFRMLFLLFLMVLSLYAFKNTLNESQRTAQIILSSKINRSSPEIHIWFETFTMQLMVKKIHFTILEMFPLEWKVVFTVKNVIYITVF